MGEGSQSRFGHCGEAALNVLLEVSGGAKTRGSLWSLLARQNSILLQIWESMPQGLKGELHLLGLYRG
jgi:hypothetical protein